MTEKMQRLLMVLGPRDIREMVMGIEAAVMGSARQRPQLAHTEALISQHETKRRVEWCVEWVLDTKKSTKWPTERLCDELGRALINWLDGVDGPAPGDAGERSMWVGPAEQGTGGA